MSKRTAFLVELYPEDLAALGFLAGLLTAEDHPQGATINDLLQRIQIVEVDEDDAWKAAGVGIKDKETEDTSEVEQVGDNTNPEDLGIEINLPPPPAPPPPINNPRDFGAGPGPGL